MATRNIELKVGIVVLTGLIVLFGSLYWLKTYQSEKSVHRVTVRFKDVGALGPGDRVTVSGVEMGKVTELHLLPNGVDVELVLDKRVTLSRDSRFVIKNMGLMGERFIAIAPGIETQLLDLTQPITGEYDSGLPEVMGLMGEMVVELKDLVSSLKSSVGSNSSLTKFSTMVNNLEQVSGSLQRYMASNENKLDDITNNFLTASQRMNRSITTNATRIDSTAARFDRMSVSLETLVNRLDTVSITARKLAKQIDEGDGTLQALLEDRRLYDDLRKAADNMDDLIADIRANPERYLKIKVSLF